MSDLQLNDFQHKHQTAFNHSRMIEAVLHASESPVTDKQLRQYLQISQNELDRALIVLQQRLSAGVLMLAKTVNGYRLQIVTEFSPLIQQIFPQRQETLSQALLETLSIIAYKQPVTRADIEQVRGVTVSSHILRQLFDKGWIEERGYKDTLGRPALLHTTSVFLEAFGLTSLNELPTMPDVAAMM
ncbi:putative transcriptional regulator [Moraxella macacae 0408225]|uniref:Putative transcriptional regulator n=1 Tax=Moraxella macacae 0408225 TaxID=1230338 RepID=L2F720_9GAMM|nr:SMC-Scp complex subunit ScpB [Moraxella macacae]ELA08695.1 putative transcriptional regulator [Moraxella macacae 0408225]